MDGCRVRTLNFPLLNPLQTNSIRMGTLSLSTAVYMQNVPTLGISKRLSPTSHLLRGVGHFADLFHICSTYPHSPHPAIQVYHDYTAHMMRGYHDYTGHKQSVNYGPEVVQIESCLMNVMVVRPEPLPLLAFAPPPPLLYYNNPQVTKKPPRFSTRKKPPNYKRNPIFVPPPLNYQISPVFLPKRTPPPR